jgi:hypothetical protein
MDRFTLTPLALRLLDNKLTPADVAALARAVKAQQTVEAK